MTRHEIISCSDITHKAIELHVHAACRDAVHAITHLHVSRPLLQVLLDTARTTLEKVESRRELAATLYRHEEALQALLATVPKIPASSTGAGSSVASIQEWLGAHWQAGVQLANASQALEDCEPLLSPPAPGPEPQWQAQVTLPPLAKTMDEVAVAVADMALQLAAVAMSQCKTLAAFLAEKKETLQAHGAEARAVHAAFRERISEAMDVMACCEKTRGKSSTVGQGIAQLRAWFITAANCVAEAVAFIGEACSVEDPKVGAPPPPLFVQESVPRIPGEAEVRIKQAHCVGWIPRHRRDTLASYPVPRTCFTYLRTQEARRVRIGAGTCACNKLPSSHRSRQHPGDTCHCGPTHCPHAGPASHARRRVQRGAAGSGDRAEAGFGQQCRDIGRPVVGPNLRCRQHGQWQ